MNTTNTNNAVTITGNGNIVAVINGKNFTATPDHPNYQKLLTNARAYDFDQFVKNYDLVANVSMYISGDVQIKDGAFIYKGHVIHNTLTKRIINFMRNDLPFLPLVKLFENLLQNPSNRAVNELYDFLDLGELPITTDGHFLAYKNVKADYKDIYTGTFDNSVGSICEMPRNLVDEDKDRTCSKGLHFCSIKYLPHFADSCGGHTMIVKINPKDVVAIPADYNNTKGRTCRYEVIGEYTENWREKLNRGENGFDHDLYDENGNEYEEDYDETCDNCGDDLTSDNYDGNGDLLCGECYDDKYSGCCGGGCHGGTSCNDEETNSNDCDENHCFCDKVDEHGDIKCDIDQNQVGNQGNDHLVGGTNSDYGVKPNGQKFHNLRDALGKFISSRKQQN